MTASRVRPNSPQQVALAHAIRYVQELDASPRHPAGRTTDPATVAARLLETGLVRVRVPLRARVLYAVGVALRRASDAL